MTVATAPAAAARRPLWRNWSGDRPCRPLELLAPRDAGEVVAAVERAAREGHRLRAVGSGHSYSDIAHTDGLMVSIDSLDELVDADPATGLVRVGAGIQLRALNRRLHELGLALPSLGEIDEQTLAGAVATDTHGSGLRFGSLSAQVAALQLVTADGTVIEVDENDAQMLSAARVGLGALGVVTEVTLRCVPAFRLHESQYSLPRAALLERLDDLAAGNDHLGVFVFPHSRRALVYERNRTPRAPMPRSRAREWVEKELIEHRLVDAVCRTAGKLPAATPALTRALAALAPATERVDDSRLVFTNEVPFRVISAEWALPREIAVQAIDAVTTLFERERFPAALPLLCRYGAASDALLSPAHGRETFYLEVLAHASAPAEPMLRATEELMSELGGRTHWAKRFRATAADLAPLYPGWERFQAVRARLDPDGMFANRWAARALGSIATTEGAA